LLQQINRDEFPGTEYCYRVLPNGRKHKDENKMRTAMLILATSLPLAFGSPVFAQTTTSPGGQTNMGGSKAVNGQEINNGKNSKSYGTGQHRGREQPEQKLDTGSGSGHQ
jgi:hypothetical protein